MGLIAALRTVTSTNTSLQKEYLEGGCDIFALALSELYGFQMYALIDPDGEYVGEGRSRKIEPLLLHAWVETPSGPFDASGHTTREKIIDRYGFGEHHDIIKISPPKVSKLWGLPSRHDVEQAKDDILQYGWHPPHL